MPSTAIKLVALREGEALAQYTLVPGEYLVGRDPACSVHIDSPEVSRKHAKLIVASGSCESDIVHTEIADERCPTILALCQLLKGGFRRGSSV